MHRILTSMIVLGALALPGGVVLAEESASTRIGGDLFASGARVVLNQEDVDDLFAVGRNVRSEAAVSGTAHMAGQHVTIAGEVGGNVYAAGMNVDVEAPVSGNVTAAGYSVTLAAPVGGDLRASGATVEVQAPVAGYALMAGETLRLDAEVTGDAVLAGETFDFGDAARVEGTLTIYAEDADAVDVPEQVAPPSRVQRHEAEDFDRADAFPAPVSRWSLIRGFLAGVLLLTALATLAAALAPEGLARLRAEALGRPVRTLWIGFLGQSALIGAAVLLALTLIGLIAAPAVLLAGFLFGLGGYVLGVYSLGVALTGAIGRPEPATLGARALAALVGSVAAGLIVLIPLLGWIFLLGLILLGCGAMLERAVRPRFFASGVPDS